jgi:drug/metabolite transporter (DMT)-like permease
MNTTRHISPPSKTENSYGALTVMNKFNSLGLTTLILFLISNAMMMNYITYQQPVDLEPIVLSSAASLAAIIIAFPVFLFTRTPPVAGTHSKALIKNYLWITLFTFTCWTSGYTALLNLNPAAFAAISLSAGSIIVALINIKRLCRIGIAGLVLIAGTVWTLVTSYSSVKQGSSQHYDYELEIGTMFSTICGISLYLIALLSKRLEDLGEPRHKIFARRSIFASLVCATIGLVDGALVTIVSDAPGLAALTLLFLILMQSALVLSVKTIGRHIVTVGIAATAVYTLITQVAFFEQSVGSIMAITIVGNALGLILMAVTQAKSNLAFRR